MYYSLLLEGEITATALFLNRKIDEGEVIGEKSFEPPSDRTTIDKDFDPWMRADLLVQVLNDYAESGKFVSFPQPKDGPGAYYVIHPVLKHLAIMKTTS